MKMAFITKGPHIHFQGFEFNAQRIRHVIKDKRSEIGLAGLWTQAGKFRNLHVNRVVPFRHRVVEGFELF